ncbi:MAG: PaaI family thioesterase [Desulfobacteraceae bacterium]|nr:PaaI family thioesterase [Desulfobacteraceae bacterium]
MNERVNQVQNLPLHRYLGVGEIDSADGKATFSVVVTERILNPAGALHGGVIYMFCDICAYAGLLSILDSDQEAVTHDIHVSVLRGAALGDTVTFSSNVIKKGKSLCFIEVIASVRGKVIATARVTKSLLS